MPDNTSFWDGLLLGVTGVNTAELIPLSQAASYGIQQVRPYVDAFGQGFVAGAFSDPTGASYDLLTLNGQQFLKKVSNAGNWILIGGGLLAAFLIIRGMSR